MHRECVESECVCQSVRNWETVWSVLEISLWTWFMLKQALYHWLSHNSRFFLSISVHLYCCRVILDSIETTETDFSVKETRNSVIRVLIDFNVCRAIFVVQKELASLHVSLLSGRYKTTLWVLFYMNMNPICEGFMYSNCLLKPCGIFLILSLVGAQVPTAHGVLKWCKLPEIPACSSSRGDAASIFLSVFWAFVYYFRLSNVFRLA